MCGCIHAYICVCACRCMGVAMCMYGGIGVGMGVPCVCTHMCVHVYAGVCVYLPVCMQACMCLSVLVCGFAHACRWARTSVHICAAHLDPLHLFTLLRACHVSRSSGSSYRPSHTLTWPMSINTHAGDVYVGTEYPRRFSRSLAGAKKAPGPAGKAP